MDAFEALEAGDPRQVGRYRIVARLGAGGMGRVYLGRSPGGRAVAVKVVRPELADDGHFRRRFAREVAAARRVNGVFTAGVVDADPDASPAWLATAYVPGVPLGDAVQAHGPWSEGRVLALGAGLAEALEAIHAADVVHRDLKPSNILLAADGPRVIDFGISVAGEASALTRTGTVVGTPGFMSPEQLTGKPVGPASDVFSLGAVLAFTATGAGPFGTGSAHALSYRVVHEQPELRQLPDFLRLLVAACLAKEPGRRPTVAALLERLGRAVEGEREAEGGRQAEGGQVAASAEPAARAGWLPDTVAATVYSRTTAHRTLAPPTPLPLLHPLLRPRDRSFRSFRSFRSRIQGFRRRRRRGMRRRSGPACPAGPCCWASAVSASPPRGSGSPSGGSTASGPPPVEDRTPNPARSAGSSTSAVSCTRPRAWPTGRCTSAAAAACARWIPTPVNSAGGAPPSVPAARRPSRPATPSTASVLVSSRIQLSPVPRGTQPAGDRV